MIKNAIGNKQISILLVMAMTLSMTGFAFVDAIALGEDENADEIPAEIIVEDTEMTPDGSGESNIPNEAPMNGGEDGPDANNDPQEPVDPEEPVPEEPEITEPAAIERILISESADGTLEIKWASVEGVTYYRVASILPDETIEMICSDSACTVNGLARNTAYEFVIEAYATVENEDDVEVVLIAKGTASYETGLFTFDESLYRTLTNRKVNASSLGIELRSKLGEGASGYSVVQGGCTDGKYAYYLMVKTSNQKGKILKVNLNNSNEVYKSPEVINICHGNGMAYDAKNHRLVVVGREARRTQLTLIDANSLRFTGYKEVDYSLAAQKGWNINYGGQRAGLAAISYVSKYNCFIALQRNTHDLLVLDQNFKVIGFVDTTILSKYPGTYQAMDVDEKYVYLVLSYYNGNQPYNRILALDWNSENLLDYINGKDPDFARRWKCNNNKSGTPDADIIVNTPHEAENLFHTTDTNGNQTFYLSEYYNNPKYKWTTKKKAYKVKWKKVKKKVKVNGKWKKKKVWKYKTKYKKVKVKVVDYYNRKNYVYRINGM